MKYLLTIILILILMKISIFAKGVEAGTIIQNRATLNFVLDDSDFSIKSNIDTNLVDQIIDVKVSWLDTDEISVHKGEQNAVLTFKILNNGNGKDNFNLSINELKNRSNFFLRKKQIYEDSNKNQYFDIDDKIITSLKLRNDQEELVFVVSDIPDDLNLLSQSKSYISLKAISQKGGSGEVGTLYVGRGVNGSDALDGLSGGVDETEGVYIFSNSNIILHKNVLINSDKSLTVIVDINSSGKNTIKKFFLKDDIPLGTKYIRNSLKLDGNYLSDMKDNDRGFYRSGYQDSTSYMGVYIDEINSLDHHRVTYKLNFQKKEEEDR